VELTTDKTTLTSGTGNRQAHPALIGLANLDMDFNMKASNHAFLMFALLPIAKFIHPTSEIRGCLQNRLYHEVMAFLVEPLKIAARLGIMMADPVGQLRICYTPLASHIVDTPESALIAGVSGKTSSVTMASYKTFGDAFRHPSRTGAHTMAQNRALATVVNPDNIEQYFYTARETFRLNGVNQLYWEGWDHSEPCVFLTPEPLHHWHKSFWDHDVKWCIHALGEEEIDFRFSILQPHTGLRHFKEGISKLKQVTGREHRDIQRFLVSIISGVVSRPFQICIRSMMDFCYRGQAEVIDDDMLLKIEEALKTFHEHKAEILRAGVKVGKGNRPIDNWAIPKLEFKQSVVPSIRDNGVPMQWTADVTERKHITDVKEPARTTNNQNYEPQICRYLDRRDKCRNFHLCCAMKEAGVDFRLEAYSGAEVDDGDGIWDPNADEIVSTTANLKEHLEPLGYHTGPSKQPLNFFEHAQTLQKAMPPRTFVDRTGSAAFHLTARCSFLQMTVDEAALHFKLPDLRAALSDYIFRATTIDATGMLIGGRRCAAADAPLSQVSKLEVWSKVHLQHKSFYTRRVLDANAIHADIPSAEWPEGRRNAAIVNVDRLKCWPQSGLTGKHPTFNVSILR
jgi:hypothetical protein